MNSQTSSTREIYLGGGCFWCMEAVFQNLKGVLAVESAYCNGYSKNPTYKEVCNGDSGHVEVVKVVFDTEQVTLEQLLEVFLAVHDPTSLNAQGADKGPQYRSGIYSENTDVLEQVKSFLKQQQSRFDQPIVTEVEVLNSYYKAEQYHQNYFLNNPSSGYCAFVVAPKVDSFRSKFPLLAQED